ncbi:MAG: D-tyrosyl-tRNA(Tyr) deacylase [Bacteroidetes bacterium]|nr:D-tyrosyl-tRNA(Tyr) deacylase [Bacteroidota bacterium]MBV6461114.1 D-aminoacyl-tRNA deacylase [Flavobacteriales bacterium]WKZ75488.1 MAG: D-aminoacyl-tRNA deacylase [Vicingaceae bacterium]MCL4815055.1 D-tyrosyl-tRNA(Tyr) deacylase [Flavobacteriales bacterium]NOG94838.1 D-tyrosyl-tRNA(Tyr) deacylase [Bacteroidota bacterium]
MRAIIQRVDNAKVFVQNKEFASIGKGMLVFLGIEEADTLHDAEWLAGKIARMRIFSDENGLMNRSVKEVNGEILLVSQFTLFASTKKGNRPSFMRSAKHEYANRLYEKTKEFLKIELQKEIKCGIFGADMQIALLNNGPVTIYIDSQNKE